MRKTVSLLVAAAVAVACGTGAWAQTAPQGDPDASCRVDATQVSGFNWDQRAAQTFTAVNGGRLTSAQVLVAKDALDGPGDYVLKIAAVNDSGVPTDEVLASDTIPAATLPNDFQTITANFDPESAATVVAGHEYALIVQRGNNDTLLNLPYRNDDPCPGGSLYWSNGGGPFWQSEGNRDLVFATHVTPPDTTPPTAPEISSPADDSYDTDGEVSLSGTAEALSTVEIFEGATPKGTATTDAQGAWSADLAGVPDGKHLYTARATDSAGNVSEPSGPRTVTVDTTRPKVAAPSPASRAREVSPGANVTATFSERVEAGSIDGTTFKLVRKGTIKAVRAKVTYNAADRKATLNPVNKLKPGAPYKATVAPGVKDLAGNALDQDPVRDGEQPMAWSFTVRR